eukprot:6405750-Lingulodinium_polyedra.AAC.1
MGLVLRRERRGLRRLGVPPSGGTVDDANARQEAFEGEARGIRKRLRGLRDAAEPGTYARGRHAR